MENFDGVRAGDILLVVDERPKDRDFVWGMVAYLGLEVTVAEVSKLEQKVWIEEDYEMFYWKPQFFSESYKNDISSDISGEIDITGMFAEE